VYSKHGSERLIGIGNWSNSADTWRMCANNRSGSHISVFTSSTQPVLVTRIGVDRIYGVMDIGDVPCVHHILPYSRWFLVQGTPVCRTGSTSDREPASRSRSPSPEQIGNTWRKQWRIRGSVIVIPTAAIINIQFCTPTYIGGGHFRKQAFI